VGDSLRPCRYSFEIPGAPQRITRGELPRAEVAPGIQGVRSVAARELAPGILHWSDGKAARPGHLSAREDSRICIAGRLRPRVGPAAGWRIRTHLVLRDAAAGGGSLRCGCLPSDQGES